MRDVSSDQLVDLAAIYDEDVELVSLARPLSDSFRTLCEELFASREIVQARWEQSAGDPGGARAVLSGSFGHELLQTVSEEIGEASGLIGDLLGCDQVGVRVTTLHSPMCPRFHVDRVPCRMLITMSGPGTEWIPSHDIDRPLLADRGSDQPPVRAGKEIRRLGTGRWSLLKGSTWDERFPGVVHRSPHLETERLLVTIDPIFAGSEGGGEIRPDHRPGS